VICRICAHQNPEQYRFCGMCGNALAPATAAGPKDVVMKAAISPERAVPEVPRDVPRVAGPVDKPRESEQAGPAVAEAQPAPRSDKWWVDEDQNKTTIGGPSILGLSSTDSGEGGNYSYLFEGERTSHAGAWVFLVMLLILGGVLYAKWRPIRDYVLTTALSHSRPQPQPGPDTKNEQPSTPATSAPATAVAGSDAPSQPAVTSQNQPEQNPAAQPKEELPHPDPPSSSAGKPDDSPKTTPGGANAERPAEAAPKATGAKLAAAKKKAANDQADDESASASDVEKSSTAQQARAPQANPGSELVSSGEKYLYARGVARNCRQAVSHFNAAAAMQNPQAFSHLGAMYATGECVPMDRAVAYAWFRRAYAREPANRYFEQNLTMLWREMTPAERQRATRKSAN
jgi:hypothetical protein